MRMRQLANATDAEIGRANRAWRDGQAEIRKYVDAVGDVPSKKVTRLEAKVAPALAAGDGNGGSACCGIRSGGTVWSSRRWSPAQSR